MVNSNKEVFGIKTIQSLLREVGLYKGRIDALFGSGCRDGVKTLVANANPSYNPIVAVPTYQASDVFKWVQEYIVRAGKAPENFLVDGKWGNGSKAEFEKLGNLYASNNSLPVYNYAWTGHPRLIPEVIAKVEAWMTKWNKPLEHVNYLFSCFALETGKTFDPAARNPSSGARGLIQFMPKGSMIDLGVTDDQLKVMSVYDQLDYVFAYFEKYGYIKKCQRLEDYYLSIFYPAHVGKDPNLVVAKEGTKIYSQNKGFDSEKKGYYTVGDIANAITTFYWEGMDPSNRAIKG
ncbi:putative transglycosylase [Aeromonas phage ZPAH34]|uniref:putative transglycosylase n=1 Tax=Aeromonas phage ZPAH34 TaxID=2924888 RepID=UPI0023295EB3|nr:putative transglycosylase [Aeromonas phage ZPAH34]UOX39477.1 putative transglycosylase [Aeromonas phage ZPAH34]